MFQVLPGIPEICHTLSNFKSCIDVINLRKIFKILIKYLQKFIGLVKCFCYNKDITLTLGRGVLLNWSPIYYSLRTTI